MKVDIKGLNFFFFAYWILHFHFKTLSSRVLNGGRVTQYLVFCACFVYHCFSFCAFFFWPLCCLFFCLLAIVLSVLLRYAYSDYPFGIFKVVIKLSFILYRSLSLYMFFFVVLVLNYFHKQTLFHSASMLTTISTPVYPLKVTSCTNDTTQQKIMSSKLPEH